MSAHPYAFLAVFLAIGILFPVAALTLAKAWFRCFQPPKPGAVKNDTYECGLPSTGESWIQFNARYYLYGLLFLVFDVEVVFLLPFATAFTGLEPASLVGILIFILLLAEGLVWAWSRGHLEWS